MLSQPDAELVRRESALPGLALALDPDAVVAALRQAWVETDVREAQAVYARYKTGTNCLVAYQVNLGGRRWPVHVKVFRPDAPRLTRVRSQSIPGGPPQVHPVVLDRVAIVVQPFPFDAKLDALERVVDSRTRGRLMQRIVRSDADQDGGDLRLLAYKPERRYVGGWSMAGRCVGTLKLYDVPDFERAQLGASVFGAREVLRVPEMLGSSKRHRAVFLRWVPGQVLGRVLGELEPAEARRQVRLVGAALAELHGQDAAALPSTQPEGEGAALDTAVRGVYAIRPSAAGPFRELARRLQRGLDERRPAPRPIHADFYTNQVIAADTGIAVLDLDNAQWGDPAADLGNFIAHLEIMQLSGQLEASQVDELAQALVEGYATAGGQAAEPRVWLQTAVGLMKLAPWPFRSRQARWPDRMAGVLGRAEVYARRTEASRSAVAPQAIPAVVPLSDPFQVLKDPAMPFLPAATDPREVARRFAARLPRPSSSFAVRAIRVTRHKPGRRCLLEYDVETAKGMVTWVGKARAKGCDEATCRIQESLTRSGFDTNSADGISVPRVVGAIPEFHLWLQEKVPGVQATSLFLSPTGPDVAARMARAVTKLHRAAVRPEKVHTRDDELAILVSRLGQLGRERPAWRSRLKRVAARCGMLLAQLPIAPVGHLHRDFYGDQVLVDGDRLYLLDLDTYAVGEPVLDIGNAIGHVIEYAIRTGGTSEAMRGVCDAFKETFLDTSPSTSPSAVDAYTTVTLARHIFISSRFPDRQAFTPDLLDLCEARLEQASEAPTLMG